MIYFPDRYHHPHDHSEFAAVRNGAHSARWLVAIAVASAFIGLSGSAAQAAQPAAMKTQVGWDGYFRIGAWTQVSCDVEVTDPGDYQLLITAPDPDAHRVTFTSPAVALQSGAQQLTGVFKAGRLSPEIQVQVVSKSSGKVIGEWNSLDVSDVKSQMIIPGTRLIVTVGGPAGFDLERNTSSDGRSDSTASASDDGILYRVVSAKVESLPANPAAYDAVNLLALAGNSSVSLEQSKALREWVARGGRLFISFPMDRNQISEQIKPLSDWLPVQVTDTEVSLRNFGKLELFAGRNVRVPFQGRMNLPVVRMEQGEYLAGSREEPLLVRSPYGQGSVIVLALDLTQAPLTNWTEVRALGRRLADPSLERDVGSARTTKSLQLSSNGISDFATQIHAIQEDFPSVHRASPWVVMGLLAVWLIVVGPLDYLIVHRLIRNPRGTWITFPILVGFGAFGAAMLADQWNGRVALVNQLNLMNIDVASSTCHQKLWTNLYNPTSVRKTVQIRPSIADGESVLTSWSGVPESSFGGMLRPIGLDVGRSDFGSSYDGQLQGLPFAQWSSKELLTESHGSADRLAKAELQADSAGRLTGTILHRLPGPIEDWCLVHGNRVYRQMKEREGNRTLPLAANVPWRVEQPNVFQRELRAFLIGQISTTKKREESMGSDVIQRHLDYDVMSRNPIDVLRILTFHNEAGGKSYSGLSNHPLDVEDLSQHVRMGRAILFGRINPSGAIVNVDGQTIKPDREDTFVRIILPVAKSATAALPELEKLGS